jgi:hypothetical protein
MQEALKLAAPIRIGLERFSGIVPRPDLCREIIDELVPSRRSGFLQAPPFIITTAGRFTNTVISNATYIPAPSSPPLKGGEILQPSPLAGEGAGEGALLINSLVCGIAGSAFGVACGSA